MRYYFDTSALVRYYHTEPGTAKVDALLREPNSTHLLSWLTVLETQSAFALKVRTGEITELEFGLLRKRLKADLSLRRLSVVRVLQRQYDRAERLLVKYAMTQRLRSLDALHLGIALDLQAAGRIESLVTADALLENVANQEGLAVQNPLKP